MSKQQGASSRRRAREVALQVLYAIDLVHCRPPRGSAGEAPAPAPTPNEVFEAVAAHFEMPVGARAFARQLVDQVGCHAEDIDSTISVHARNWRLSRMAAVDRNILRMGTYELIYTDAPGPVILNEAVDLARRFGSDPSPAFVNGILDAVARGVRELGA